MLSLDRDMSKETGLQGYLPQYSKRKKLNNFLFVSIGWTYFCITWILRGVKAIWIHQKEVIEICFSLDVSQGKTNKLNNSKTTLCCYQPRIMPAKFLCITSDFLLTEIIHWNFCATALKKRNSLYG